MTLVLTGLFAVATLRAFGQSSQPVETNYRYAGNSTGSSGFSGDFVIASTTTLSAPSYTVADSAGNIFLSDTQNNCVRKISPSGAIATIAGLRTGTADTCNTTSNATPAPGQGLLHPTGLAIDSANNLYIADTGHNCVLKMPANSIDSTGTPELTVAAGTCNATDTLSTTPAPNGLAIDPSGNLYISIQDTTGTPAINQVVRATGGAVCLIAGQASAALAMQCSGIPNTVTLSSPSGLAFDPLGDLYIADTTNNCIREISFSSTPIAISTAVGQCINDHTGSSATALISPYGLAVSPTSALYISQSAIAASNVLSFAPGSGTLTRIAGPSTGSGAYTSAEESKPALSANLNTPRGIAVNAAGDLFIADTGNNIVRRLTNGLTFPSTNIGSSSTPQIISFLNTQAVNLTATVGPDYTIGPNTCTGALAPGLCQVTVTFTPTLPGTRGTALKLTDSSSGRTSSTGITGTGIGPLSLLTPGIASSIATGFRNPIAVSVDASGNSYVLEQGNASTTADILLIPAGGGAPQVVVPQGAGLQTPTAMAVDAAGNIYVTDALTGGVTRFGADGSVNTSYVTGLASASAIAIDPSGNLYIAQAGSIHNVVEFYAAGGSRVITGAGATPNANNIPAIDAQLVQPAGLVFGPNGLAVADSNGLIVYTIDASGIIHMAVGNGTTTATNANVALDTALLRPIGLAYDAAGDLYIADKAANRVYVAFPILSSSVNIITVIGTGVQGYAGDGTPATSATINAPVAVAVDSQGNVIVVDSGNNALREVSHPTTATLAFGSLVIGNTSTLTQSFTNIGNAPLALTTPFTTNNTHYTISTDPSQTTCTGPLSSGGVCTIGYTYTPTMPTGAQNGQSIVLSNSSTSPQTIILTARAFETITLAYTLPAETEVYGYPFTQAASLTIHPGDPSPDGTMTFTISPPSGAQTCTTAGPFTSVVTCNATESGLNVGTYPVTFNYTSSDNNYHSATTTGTLTVTRAPMTVIGSNVTIPYGAPIPNLNPLPSPVSIQGAVNRDIFTPSQTTTAVQGSLPGTYPINVTLTPQSLASLSNYAITNVPGTLTITARPLTITLNSFTRAYNTANPTLTYTISGAVNGDTFTVTPFTTATTNSPAGTYPITATVTGANIGLYAVTVVPGTLTVTAPPTTPLTVTINSTTRPVGTPNPTFTYSISGALHGDTFTVTPSTIANIGSPAGTYPITATVTGANIAAYTVTVVPGTLTVTAPTPLTVTVNNASRLSGTPNPTFTYSISGALHGDTFTVTPSTIANINSPAGTYPITATVTGANIAAYTLTVVPGTLTVTAPTPLTVTVNNTSRPFGTPNPTFTSTIAGALNGDTFTVAYSTPATTGSPVGTYPITATVTGANLGNYSLKVMPGTLTVTPVATSMTFITSGSPANYGAPVTFTSTVTSAIGVPGGTVNFMSGTTLLGTGTLDANGVATFTTSSLPPGTATITAVYTGSGNFSSSTGTLTQIINAGSFILSATPPSQFVRGPGTTTWTVNLTSQQSFAGPVALTCAGLPADATCTFAQPTVTLDANGTATTTMTVINTAADYKARLTAPAAPTRNPLAPIAIAASLPFELSGLGLLFFRSRRRSLKPGRLGRVLFTLIGTAAIFSLVGCACFTSNFKNYTITITGSTTVPTVAPASTSVILSVGAQ